jgi:UDP-N-acetylglucosamine--N-acetylmuramyl-(pentapeptide) pyrophosphoryl-undecaprenol N-acetylglucosamine transferase
MLEPNAEPGLTNRLLEPIVDEIWGPPQSNEHVRAKYYATGVPIRAALRALPSRADAIARLGLDASRSTLLAMGGSQGARSINDAIVALGESRAVPAGWQVLALTGARDYARVRASIPAALPYLDDMADAYAAADLVLARAGASTLGELAALAKPAILVPYPHAAQDHQTANAARFAAAGAALVLTDRELQTGGLPAVLARAAAPARLQELASGAARLAQADPIGAILARIESLLSRKS